MRYRKLKGDFIFDGFEMQEGKVLIVDESGKVEALVPENEAPDAEYHAGILSPGFINCHCHLELSHMKGLIPEGTGLVDFVLGVVTQRHFAEDEIREAIAKAEADMKAAGIVAVGDICNNTLTLEQKQKSNLRYHNFIEASGWLPSVADVRFSRALGIYKEFTTHHSPLTTLVPHAPYSVSAELWRQLKPYFKNNTVSIHNQETAHENDFFQTGSGDFQRMYELMKIDNSHHQPTGKTSVQSYFHHLSEASRLLLVHNTFTSQEDLDFIQNSKFKIQNFLCLCVNANLYIEKALPPLELLRSNNMTIVLGTDSLASNWSLSIADEMRTMRKHFPAIPLVEMLRWATSNGANALGIIDRFGSFEAGKKPGVLCLQPESLLVRSLA
ncbi:MAG: amidohydrolase family protein [Flaviaesturariibacter sp.]|nr:amidohydrolase family protein [Flaviaesturariibacter sp.]